ncbi:Plant-drug/metabolite exporter [Parasponia andersonii]|uniref:WAT1-related protein n=1 Tax=Parasponia andersonii TaxID=3476 RepID=A0A2P5C5W0_PARAD|nr:Plant-drug/metabolite exporter [Parasponia andersonii]
MEEQSERVRGKSKRQKLIQESIPYVLCLFCNVCAAGYYMVSKVSLNKGLSRYVLVTYGYAFGTLATALLAFLFERNKTCKMTIPVLRNCFLIGVLGAVLARTMFFMGLQYTSQAFASALSNIFPAFTFVLAVLFRMEKLDITKHSSQAKIGGTILSFIGAIVMSLVKGITAISIHGQSSHNQSASTSKLSFDKGSIKGSSLLVASELSSAALYILQTKTVKMYAAPLTLTALSCLSGTLLSTIMTAILDHRATSWRLSWNITLFAPLYNGVMVIGLVLYVRTVVIQRKGPVFATAFNPLSTIVAAVAGLFILGEALHLGSIIGAMLTILGLYAILWGKKKEEGA